MLNAAALLIRTDRILITHKFSDTVNIVPSQTNFEFSHKDGCYIGPGNVINLSCLNIVDISSSEPSESNILS